MKFLIAAIAASLTFPTAALAESKSESWYLVIAARHGYYSGALQALPMNSEEQCIEAGNKIYESKEKPNDIHGIFHHVRYVCVKGK
jgi:hypothetical protein